MDNKLILDDDEMAPFLDDNEMAPFLDDNEMAPFLECKMMILPSNINASQ